MTRTFQFQAFLGPRFLPYSDMYNYPWYIHFPAPDLDIALDYKTAVATTLADGAVTLVTTNDALLYNKFADGGGLWLGPAGAGQGWEHVDYLSRTLNSFTGLRRESSLYRDHNGVHAVGAEVRFWYPVVSDAGQLHFMDEVDEKIGVRSWRFELKGFVLPPSLLRADYHVAICYRQDASSALKLFAYGVSDSVQIRDTFEKQGAWTLFVSSFRGLMENTMIHGVQFGDLNVAQNGDAQSSAPLGSPYKEILSGDFTAAEPDLTAKSAIDGVLDTLFISDFMVGTLIAPTYNGVTQMYLSPHPGRGPAYKWIELTNFSTASSTLKAYDPARGTDMTLDFTDFSVASGDYRVILTDDPVTFALENPASEADYIVAVPTVGLGPAFMKFCNPAGGALSIWGSVGGASKVIVWGNVNITTLRTFWGLSGTDWVGVAIAAPGYGQTIAYRHGFSPPGGSGSAANWQVVNYGTPGYQPRPDRGNRSWLAVYLPPLGLFVRDDVLTGATVVYTVDSAGNPSTEGLPSSGTLQLGSVQVPYTGKAADSLTGCTVPSGIKFNALVKVLQAGIACDGFPLSKIVLRRDGRAGEIMLSEYYLRVCRVLARLPDSSDYDTDYATPYGATTHVTGNGAAVTTWSLAGIDGGSNVRARAILLEFRRMTVDPAAGRLNELEAIADTSAFSASYYLPSPSSPGEAVFRLLGQVGIPPGAINYNGVAQRVSRNFRSAREWAWKTILDICDMAGIFVNLSRDSRISITDNAFYTTPVGGYTMAYSWGAAEVTVVDYVARSGEGVGQVRFSWESLDGLDSGVVVYPSVMGDRGGVHDVGPYLVANEAAALLSARKRFFLLRAPYFAVVELVDVNLSIRPGQYFDLTWPFPGDNVPLKRRYVVQGVDLAVAEGAAVQVVTGLMFDREVGY